MEQLQALERLRSIVDAIGFPLTLRILAGIAKDHRERMEDTDYKRTCDEIAATITLAADSLCGESAR